jgi:uncharacterized protein (DUF1330 family)
MTDVKAKILAMLAVVATVATGTFGISAIFAQTQSQPRRPAFYISEFEVNDPDGIKPYSQQVEATFAPFTGRYLVRGGQTSSLEGEQPKRIVMIAFDSMAQAQAWYGSPAYRAIRPIRLQSAKSRVYIVEGAPNEGR